MRITDWIGGRYDRGEWNALESTLHLAGRLGHALGDGCQGNLHLFRADRPLRRL